MNKRLELSSKAHFSGPLVGAVVPFNAVHRSCTEDPQLDEAASKRSLTTSQLRDHVFNWRSDPWTDVSHQVSVDPVDDAGIDISHLEQRWNLGVPGTAIDPNHISHAPGTFRVSDDHGHACFVVQENGI